jgi:hypothetical protein
MEGFLGFLRPDERLLRMGAERIGIIDLKRLGSKMSRWGVDLAEGLALTGDFRKGVGSPSIEISAAAGYGSQNSRGKSRG